MRKVTAAQRQHLVALMELMRQHASQLDYPPGDVRGPRDAWTFGLSEAAMRDVLARGGRLCFDCSQFAQQLFRWAGLQDPCGLGYRYAGDTGAMLRTLPTYEGAGNGWPGSLAVYGPGRGEHVSVFYARSADPLLCSHGRSGLDFVHLSAQRTWHTPPVRLLSILQLG